MGVVHLDKQVYAEKWFGGQHTIIKMSSSVQTHSGVFEGDSLWLLNPAQTSPEAQKQNQCPPI